MRHSFDIDKKRKEKEKNVTLFKHLWNCKKLFKMGSCSSTKQTTVVQDNKNENSPPVSTAVSPEQTREEFERKYTQLSSKTIKIEDFQLQRTIAMTTFGRIMLVKRNNQLMSLKIMPKANIIELGQVKHILSEKSILQAVSFPFIVNFICAFKDNTNLYYAFEYVPGGDMYTQLQLVHFGFLSS